MFPYISVIRALTSTIPNKPIKVPVKPPVHPPLPLWVFTVLAGILMYYSPLLAIAFALAYLLISFK